MLRDLHRSRRALRISGCEAEQVKRIVLGVEKRQGILSNSREYRFEAPDVITAYRAQICRLGGSVILTEKRSGGLGFIESFVPVRSTEHGVQPIPPLFRDLSISCKHPVDGNS